MPTLESLDKHALELARLVARTSWLPHPKTVKEIGGAVFPTIRSTRKRFELYNDGNKVRGMYDDNTTPRWALFWPHGIRGGSFKGWNVAHVWAGSARFDCYTHPANLLLIPDSLASLTDKDAPVARYLRWHAWKVYGWRPAGEGKPIMPKGYGRVKWRYFEHLNDPLALIRLRFAEKDNQRTKVLAPIMKQQGLL